MRGSLPYHARLSFSLRLETSMGDDEGSWCRVDGDEEARRNGSCLGRGRSQRLCPVRALLR